MTPVRPQSALRPIGEPAIQVSPASHMGPGLHRLAGVELTERPLDPPIMLNRWCSARVARAPAEPRSSTAGGSDWVSSLSKYPVRRATWSRVDGIPASTRASRPTLPPIPAGTCTPPAGAREPPSALSPAALRRSSPQPSRLSVDTPPAIPRRWQGLPRHAPASDCAGSRQNISSEPNIGSKGLGRPRFDPRSDDEQPRVIGHRRAQTSA